MGTRFKVLSWYTSRFVSVSSLPGGHANPLCVVPILSDDPCMCPASPSDRRPASHMTGGGC